MTVRSAAVAFVVMLMFVGGCKRESADELLKTAEMAYGKMVGQADSLRVAGVDMKSAFAPVLESYEKVIHGYPGTPQAERALGMLATIRHNDTHEPDLAIEGYTRYIKEFPEGKQAGLSMFLIGYIYNNDLHNLDSSSAAYKRFLQKYPQHEMASSAQFELDNLGKSAEDLLAPGEKKRESSAQNEKRLPGSKSL